MGGAGPLACSGAVSCEDVKQVQEHLRTFQLVPVLPGRAPLLSSLAGTQTDSVSNQIWKKKDFVGFS